MQKKQQLIYLFYLFSATRLPAIIIIIVGILDNSKLAQHFQHWSTPSRGNTITFLNANTTCYVGAVGLGDPVPGDLHGHLHALRGRLPPERARLRNPSHGTRRSHRCY